MKVLCDYHHNDLFYSLQLLFERRLGWELYRPIGLDWQTEGFWNVYPHPATAQQFLGLDQAVNHPRDIRGQLLTPRECINATYTVVDGVYFVEDPTKGAIERAVTLPYFKANKFDIVISSIPQHIEPYNKLIALYQPHAKHIFQVGNAWGHQPGISNILASTAPFAVPSGINACFYHQEFDTSIFNYAAPTTEKGVSSFIHYMNKKELMNEVATLLPDWKFRSYGAGMEDTINRTEVVASTMKASGWTWHYKPEGDGYGHILHNSFACGRPVITDSRHYQNKLGAGLLEHGLTCLDLAYCSDSPEMITRLLLSASHEQMCLAARQRFEAVVNFDYEFEKTLKPFLERLL
jgi:hypothetical protein